MDRNRVKRLLRDAFVRVAPHIGAGADVVVVARPEARELAEREGLEGVTRELAALVARSTGESEPER